MRDTIEDLYRAYAGVPLNPDVEYCDHCVAPEQVVALHAYPLRLIPAASAGRLLTKGLSTWGDAPYFRHFVPRLLELTAAGELNDFSVAIYLPGKLVPCLAAGTPEERTAVHRFLATWWTSTLATWPAPVEATDVYEIATRTGVPAGPLLGQWPAAEPGHLAAFVTDAAQRDPGPEVAEWLRSEVPAALLTAAGNTATDLELLEELSWALESLEVVQHELAGGLGDRTGQ